MNNDTTTLNEFIDKFLKDASEILNSYKGLIISNLSLTNFKRNTEKAYFGKYYIDAFSNKHTIKLLLPILVLNEAKKSNHKIDETVSVDVTIDSVNFDNKGTILISVSKITETGIGEQEIFERNLDIFCKENLIYQRTKKQIPTFIKKIALITTTGTNTVEDIKKNLIYNKELDLFNVNNSSIEIAKKILECQNIDYDVVLLFRGGHQDKAMNIYSDIPVIKAIAYSKIHIGAALGHETDFPFIYKIVDSYYSTPTNFAQIANEHNINQIINFDNSIGNIGHYIDSLKRILANDYLSIKTSNFKYIMKHLSADLELKENKINKETLTIIHKNEKSLDNLFYLLNTINLNKINQIEKTLHTSNLNINDNIKNNIQLQVNTLDHVFNNIENINNINYNILQSELDKTLFNIETASSKLISSINIKSTKKKYLVINILILILSFIVFYIFYF
ncbi:exodeoxyribonuclease VII large subunit [Aliarcobacter skirrowii]|uniref:exodeoxyribonuclease VII large subunit n=1 Tax=Aliarcobacter skirrowii TaxID=28200 RepID=UPI00082C2209|nr:exodeoxyribonuclease VII large subunit [Aliarcobacter skirrowii]